MNSDKLFCTLLDATFDDAMVLFSSQKHDIEGVLEIILHQQSTQKNVQECLEKFRVSNLNDLETICNTDDRVIENLITKYAKIKTKRIKVLFEEILSYFLDFENFKENVDLSWFENIKGISRVNAEMILLKICERNILPVTTPLKKILEFLGYEFESYDEAQEWLCSFDADIIKKKFDFEDSEKILLLFVIAAEIFYEKFTKNGKFTSASQKILNPLLKD